MGESGKRERKPHRIEVGTTVQRKIAERRRLRARRLTMREANGTTSGEERGGEPDEEREKDCGAQLRLGEARACLARSDHLHAGRHPLFGRRLRWELPGHDERREVRFRRGSRI